jgi:glycosyltransferase involved in cell wall biosynthesis
VVNIPRFFLSHRLPLALAARDAGFDVHVATSDADRESTRQIGESGLAFHPLKLYQHGLNPVGELRTLYSLMALYRKLKPALLHHVSIKPVLYGGIAARLSGRPNIVQAMSGLGYVFTDRSAKARLLELLSRPAFKLALAGDKTRLILQNPDDRQVFIQRALIDQHRTRVIRGSGVDETLFRPRSEDKTNLPVVLFAGRLLWRKGIGDFAEAARRLRGKARFQVVGYEEATSPLHVSSDQLASWQAEGLIEWLGARDDMPAVYGNCNIVCLPSTYGEGVPKVLIEAAACARACVATDTPGCREIVRDGVNGLLVPPDDGDALARALARLLDDPAERARMGKAGREIVLNGFTLRQVIGETLALYGELLQGEWARDF